MTQVQYLSDYLFNYHLKRELHIYMRTSTSKDSGPNSVTNTKRSLEEGYLAGGKKDGMAAHSTNANRVTGDGADITYW